MFKFYEQVRRVTTLSHLNSRIVAQGLFLIVCMAMSRAEGVVDNKLR